MLSRLTLFLLASLYYIFTMIPRTLLLLVGMLLGVSLGYSQTAPQAPRVLSADLAQRLAADIRPAIAAMVGGDDLIAPELLDGIVATSLTDQEGQNLILYSPIYAVVVVMHIDRFKRKYVYALGPRDLAWFVGQSINAKSNYLTLRYRQMPTLLADLRQRLRSQPNETISKLHEILPSWRKPKENLDGLLMPVLRQVDPSNVQCIRTLDKGTLVANIRDNLEDKKDEGWFDNMTMGDIITDEDGNKTIIFVNDLTRRLHIFVPVSQQGDRCVPGIPRTTFIQ